MELHCARVQTIAVIIQMAELAAQKRISHFSPSSHRALAAGKANEICMVSADESAGWLH
jgi:hypothetical protein